jgi:hypothetical protein
MANLLFMAVMYADEKVFEKAKAELVKKYGSIKAESSVYDFKFTNYYEPEMGSGLKKLFLVFEKEISKKDLADIKFFITEIEKRYSKGNNRVVNIDPGYLSSTELQLATFKEKSFKEKIHEKVWIHKVLEFDGNNVKQFFHTFADYRDKKNQEFIINNKPKQ